MSALDTLLRVVAGLSGVVTLAAAAYATVGPGSPLFFGVITAVLWWYASAPARAAFSGDADAA
jgi:hypothetical protein